MRFPFKSEITQLRRWHSTANNQVWHLYSYWSTYCNTEMVVRRNNKQEDQTKTRTRMSTSLREALQKPMTSSFINITDMNKQCFFNKHSQCFPGWITEQEFYLIFVNPSLLRSAATQHTSIQTQTLVAEHSWPTPSYFTPLTWAPVQHWLLFKKQQRESE